MNFVLLHNRQPVSWTKERPIPFSSVIPYEEQFHAEWEEGQAVFQKTLAGENIIWLSDYDIKKETIIGIAGDAPILVLHVALETPHLLQFSKAPALPFGKNQYMLLYLPDPSVEIQVREKHTFMLDVLFQPQYLAKWQNAYTVFIPFFEAVYKQQQAQLTPAPINASATLLKGVHQLLQCPYQGGLRSLILEARLTDIISDILEQASGLATQEITLTEEEKERILQIKALLEERPDLRFTYRELGLKVFMNELKFRKGFQQLVGSSVFNFHLNVRMHKAIELLLHTDLPLSDIAEKTGYQHTSSFIDAFKTLYDYTPAQYRKRFRK